MAFKDVGFSTRKIVLKISKSYYITNNFLRLNESYDKNPKENNKLIRRQLH